MKVVRSIITLALMTSVQAYSAEKVLVFSAIEGINADNPIVKVLEHAYKKLDIDIKIQSLQGNRGVALSNKGILDGEILRSKSVEVNHTNLIRVDFPLDSSQLHFFVKRGNEFKVTGWDSIPDEYYLGYPDGLKIIQTAIIKHQLKADKSSSLQVMFKKLDAGRNDVVVAGVNRLTLINEMGLNEITLLEPPIETHFLYHYLHEKHSELVPKITEIVKEMWVSGELFSIRDMYEE